MIAKDAVEPAETDSGTARRRLASRRTAGALIGLIVLVGLGIGAYHFWRYTQTYESTDDAQIDSHLNMITTRIPGAVQSVRVVENQPVKAGDLLVELDPKDYQVALLRAQAMLAQAQAQVRAGRPAVPITATTIETRIVTGRANVASAEAALVAARRDFEAQAAKVAQAEAEYARAQSDLARYEELVKKDRVSRQEYDQKVAAAKSSAAALESARAASASARQLIEQRAAALAQATSELEQTTRTAPDQMTAQRAAVESQQANVAAARAAHQEAALNLEYTKILSPISGVVGRKNVEVGQRIQPGQQLMAVVPLDDIWVTANFKETQLRLMQPGQKATIHVDASARDYDGYVESLPPATAGRFSILPPENASGNFVKVVQRLPVRLRFNQGQDPQQRLRPGMSVVPKVWFR